MSESMNAASERIKQKLKETAELLRQLQGDPAKFMADVKVALVLADAKESCLSDGPVFPRTDCCTDCGEVVISYRNKGGRYEVLTVKGASLCAKVAKDGDLERLTIKGKETTGAAEGRLVQLDSEDPVETKKL